MGLQICILPALLLLLAVQAQASEREELTAQERDLQSRLIGLTNKYDALCDEMRLLSQHVVFLEQALSDLSHHGDVLYRKKRDVTSEAENTVPSQTLEVTPDNGHHAATPADPVTAATVNTLTTEDDSLIILRVNEAADPTEATSDPSTTSDREEISGKPDAGFKCDCNLLHEYSCPIDKSKSFDNQFNDWYHNLLFSMSQNCSLGAKEFAKRLKSKHRHRSQHRRHRNIPTGNSSLHHVPTMNPVHLDQMEQTLIEDDTVYATCDVTPNRHISLILQQNIKGRVNLWQRSDGRGPLHVHVQLSGFRVATSERRRRETNLMPVETASDSGSNPALSLDHGFHVHTTGDLSRSCQSTGTHFNPTNSSHGGPMDSIRHAGDLGNIRVDERGNIDAEYSYPYVSLVGENSIIGRSLVIHSLPDDFSPSATGNSGAKIACCVVEKVARLPVVNETIGSVEPIQAPKP